MKVKGAIDGLIYKNVLQNIMSYREGRYPFSGGVYKQSSIYIEYKICIENYGYLNIVDRNHDNFWNNVKLFRQV